MQMIWQKSKPKMQGPMDRVSQACDNNDLTISTLKVDVLNKPTYGNPYNEPTITATRQRLQVVDKFTYLRNTLSRSVQRFMTDKASVAFGRLEYRHCCLEKELIHFYSRNSALKKDVNPTVPND